MKGGGCPATPTLAPCAYNPEPLRGHERVRGKEDGCVDEGGGGRGGQLVSSFSYYPSPPLLLFRRTAAPELHRFPSTPNKNRDCEKKGGLEHHIQILSLLYFPIILSTLSL